MHARIELPPSRAAGGIKVWTAIVILALCCVIAVVALQVQEYLFYKEAPSVWPAPGTVIPPVPPIAPMPESIASTSQPSAEVGIEPETVESIATESAPQPVESAETESEPEFEVEDEVIGENVPVEYEPDE